MTVDEHLKDACREACAEFGDPPCYELVEDPPAVGPWKACETCWRAIGLEPPEAQALDPDAVVRPLI